MQLLYSPTYRLKPEWNVADILFAQYLCLCEILFPLGVQSQEDFDRSGYHSTQQVFCPSRR